MKSKIAFKEGVLLKDAHASGPEGILFVCSWCRNVHMLLQGKLFASECKIKNSLFRLPYLRFDIRLVNGELRAFPYRLPPAQAIRENPRTASLPEKGKNYNAAPPAQPVSSTDGATAQQNGVL
jgi:hypothetical protein